MWTPDWRTYALFHAPNSLYSCVRHLPPSTYSSTHSHACTYSRVPWLRAHVAVFFSESTRGFFFAFQRLLRFMSHGRRALAAQLLTPPVCVVWETLSWLGIGGTRAVGSSLIALGCVYSRGLAPQGLMRDWGLGGCVSAVLTLRRGRNCSS